MKEQYTLRLKKIEEVLLSQLPESVTSEWISETFGILPGCITAAHIQNLIEPCRNLMLLGGKRWRPLLLVLCAELASGSENVPAAYSLTPLVEFIHTASLIHDDIEDNADTRRGKPAAHIAYGTDTAINAGAWLYFKAAAITASLPVSDTLKNRLYGLFSKELSRLHLGQALDIAWHRENSTVPSADEYAAMVRLKTGTLASFAAQAGILSGGGTDEAAAKMGLIAADIGVSFQIIDDVINLTTGNKGKQRGDDIVEGKKSLPVLLHLQKHPEDFQRVMDCFQQARTEGIQSAAVETCIGIIASDGSIDSAKDHASRLLDEACNRITQRYGNVPASEHITGLFRSMMQL